MTHDEIWAQFHELEEDYAMTDPETGREERIHLAAEMNENIRAVDNP